MDVAKEVNIREKIHYVAAQVNDIKEYTGQTLGNIIGQMSTVVIRGITIALILY